MFQCRKGGQCISAAEVHAESRKGCIKSLLAPSLAPFLGAHKQMMNSYLFLYLTFTFLHRSCSCSQDLSLVAAGAEDGHLLAIFSLSIEALTPPCLKTEQRPERHYDKFLLQLLTLNVCIIFYSRLSLWTSELATRSSHSKWKPLNAECINMLSLSLQLRAVAARTCHEGWSQGHVHFQVMFGSKWDLHATPMRTNELERTCVSNCLWEMEWRRDDWMTHIPNRKFWTNTVLPNSAQIKVINGIMPVVFSHPFVQVSRWRNLGIIDWIVVLGEWVPNPP